MVITCSDTRTPETDTSGLLIRKLLEDRGHTVDYHLVKDEPAQIQLWIARGTVNETVKAIIINGGTGISRRDSTYEAVDEMLEKRLTGFGEIFRLLTYQDIGSPAIMSRACFSPSPARNMPSASRWKSSFFLSSAMSSENWRNSGKMYMAGGEISPYFLRFTLTT
jgi:molybdenum cofactor synthesis domain-containing protein